jgi:hypothetical protein
MPLPFLVTALVNIAISIGLSYISKKLQKKEQEKARKKAKKEAAANSGSILDIQYGEGQPRVVAIGKVATAGQAVYDNTFGTANKTLQRVLKISDFRCTSLARVAIDNAWVSLGSLDATKGYPVTSGDYSGLIWVKFLSGSQTTADTYLTGNDNPDGRWTTNHKGIGCCYVIVTCEYDDEKLNSIPEMLFEVEGAPLYDFRLDSSVGGSGSHRWNDVTTWAFSENPILAEYNYRMGFYTGTYGSGHDTFCGMGMSQSELDYTRYAAAADICDQTAEGEDRYRVSTFLEADNEHGDNIEELMLACAGMIVEGVTGPFPILGATQSSVATLTNDDLIADAPVEFRLHRPVSEVVNTVSGVYSEPNFVYAETGYSKQQLASAVTLDRRTIDYNLNLPMVPSKRQAEQLASIYLSENRFEAVKTVTVHPKWLVLEVGDWITWTDDEDGAASRIYQIVSMTILAVDNETPRAVQLTLQERDEDIYAGIGAVSAPTAPTRPGAPTYLQELQSFSVAPITVEGSGGHDVPAIVVSWAAVTDPTVESILIEWRPTGDDSRRVAKVMSRNATVAILQEGVVGSTEYQVRNTIIPRPARTTTPSAWSTVTTDPPGAVGLGMLDEATIGTLENYREDLTRLFSTQNRTALGTTESIIAKAEEVLGRRGLKAQIGNVSAAVAQEQIARIDGDTALAGIITAVESEANDTRALLVQEQTTRANADTALAADITVLDSTVGTVQAGLSTEISTRASADSALSASITSLNSSLGTTNANLVTEQTTRANADTALSQSITAVSARADQGSAQGLIKLEAIAAPSGVTARFGTYLRTSTVSGFPTANAANAAEFLEIKDGVSRKVIKATQTVFSDSANNIYAMFDASGANFNNAQIKNLTSASIAAGAITADKIAAGAITAAKIQAGTITADRIVAAGITQLYAVASGAFQQEAAGNWQPYGSAFGVNVPANAGLLLQCSTTGTHGRPDSGNTQFAIFSNGVQISPVARLSPAVGGAAVSGHVHCVTYLPAGGYTIQMYFRSSGGGWTATITENWLSGILFYR